VELPPVNQDLSDDMRPIALILKSLAE